MIDLTFESEIFNDTIIVEGTAIVTIGINSASGASAADFYFVITIAKWDGTNTTQLGKTTVNEIQNLPWTKESINSIPVVCSRTPIGAGETLRTTIELWGKVANGTHEYVIGHDGKNRDGTSLTPSTKEFAQTEMTTDLPVRIRE